MKTLDTSVPRSSVSPTPTMDRHQTAPTNAGLLAAIPTDTSVFPIPRTPALNVTEVWSHAPRQLGSICILPELSNGLSRRRLVADRATGTEEWFDSPEAANAFALRLHFAKVARGDISRFG